jgi:serine/threonine protein kinase/tetratricopeptide (TPR) repeat protein
MIAADASQDRRTDPALELDAFVAAFESAATGGAAPDPGSFLPPPDHPLYDAVLREIVRVDLEFAWSRGTRRRVEEYRERFPQLFRDPDVIRDLVHEEYRLRRAAGETPHVDEYRSRLGVDVASFSQELRTTCAASVAGSEWPSDRIPTVGDTIPPGYELVSELGRGAFGRVYLARETGLAGRPVAVKVSTQLAGEPLTLARLQHTNIVPVYAAHRLGRFTALVMPYVGRTTLGDLIATLRSGRVEHSGSGVASTLAGRTNGSRAEASGAAMEHSVRSPGRSATTLSALERMTFVEAVLWIGAELADGLAHAHECGVLHRDIKPANVLFTDDGRPMLLDFNLAEVAARRVAGTPAYMAPEQLAAAHQNLGLATVQTDLYALGLMLVELLAGRHPFGEPAGRWEDALPGMIAARQNPLEGLSFPRGVTPGVRAILAKCLHPDPSQRYTSARALREDLNRQRLHQPLRHAAERSVRERVRKWAKRHPRLSSGGSIAVIAVIVLGALATAYLGNRWRLERKEAELAHLGLRDAREFVQSGGPGSPPTEWRAVRDAARDALAAYKHESDEWINGPLVRGLPEKARRELRRDAAQVMFRAAEATSMMARDDAAERENLLAEALEWNRRARSAFPGTPPRPFLRQRAALLRSSGRAAEADQTDLESMRAAAPEEDDIAGLGFAALERGDYREATARFSAAAQTGPPRYSVWMGLAAAESRCGRYASAVDALSAASALRPTVPWPFFHRGFARMELKDHAGAASDFDRFLELAPDEPDGLLNRAICRLERGDSRGAITDLDRAEQVGSRRSRLYRIRELAKRASGDNAGADRDRESFLKRIPSDPLSWCARGELRLALNPPDTKGALADFDEALKLDPDNLNALRDKAAVPADEPGHRAEAIATLDRVLKLVPEAVGDRAGRAVLLARAGRKAEARADIDACVAARPAEALVHYQLASAALLMGDKGRGLSLLRTSLRKDPSLAALMPSDSDLELVWKDAAFLNLITAARTLNND